MKHRRWPIVALLIGCGVLIAVKPLLSDDDAPAEPPPPKIMTRMYDIRGLITPADNFPFTSSPHADAFIFPPGSQGFQAPGGYGSGGQQSPFVNADPPRPHTRDESAEDVIRLIADDVASDTWKDSGGTQGSIRYLDGILIIQQTESAHKEIADLLHHLSDLRAEPVRTTAEWVLVPPGEVDKLLKAPPAANTGEPREVDMSAVKRLPASVAHYHVELPGHNGQTLHAVSGTEESVTINQQSTVGTGVAAYTPLIGQVATGVAIEVTPNVDHERKTAVLNLWSAYNDGKPSGPIMTLHSFATTQPTPDAKPVVSEASASYHETTATVQELRTTLRIPLNKPVIAGAMTLLPAAGEKDDRQLVLIVCVHSSEKASAAELP